MRSEELYIAEFCLRYLNFGCFDADLIDSEIQEFYRQGYYLFEDYAIAHWLDHVDSSTSQPAPWEATSLESLVQEIQSFFAKHGSDSAPDLAVISDEKFQCIRQCDFARRLDSLAQIALERRSNEGHLDLETQLQRRRLVYEDLVSKTDLHSAQLHDASLPNGSGWFKCPKTWCEFFFDGFRDTDRRSKHVSQHERPFRCSFEECLYAQLGYETEKALRAHERKSHPNGLQSEWAFPRKRSKIKLDIFSASKKGDLATIERLVEEGADLKQTLKQKGRTHDVLSLAVRHNHPHVVSYLIGQGCFRRDEIILSDAVAHSSIAIVQMLIEMEASPEQRLSCAQCILENAAMLGRKDVIPLVLTYGVDINPILAPHKLSNWAHSSFLRALLANGATDERPELEHFTPTPATMKNLLLSQSEVEVSVLISPHQ